MSLDRFYPIFDDVAWLKRILPLGVKLVQLRLKDRPKDDIAAQVVEAEALSKSHDATLIINDHWQAAIDAGSAWVHLGQEDLDIADMPAIKRAGLRVGLSTHDETELDRALSFDPDYIALGPVYPTILKKMKWHQQGLPRVSEWKSRIGGLPLVGIGGMNIERAPGVFEAGADIVSVVTDITLNPHPEARVRQWLEVTR